MRPPFTLFGPAHLIALGFSFAVPLMLAAITRRAGAKTDRDVADRAVRAGLAVLLLTGWACWYILFGLRGWLTLDNGLPLNLCDWASFALIAALVTRNARAYELGYFWGLGGTLQGVLTPDIGYGFPDPQFFFFFVEHGGILASLLYLTLGTGMRPHWRALPRVVAATLCYACVAGLTDWALGTNYAFLRAKPPGASLLSVMSPWPWYIPELVLAGLLSVLLYYLPFALADRARTRAAKN